MPDLAALLVAVRTDGRTRDVQCPAHADQRASLSVSRGAEGRLLLHCHAGCTLEAVLAAAQLDVSALFEQRGAAKRIVAVYHYLDEHGTPVFDVVRFAPKDFRQRRADGVWTMRGVRRVLYRLPEFQRMSTVYVVEGEKDADRLAALGLPSTTNPGGAGKWRADYTQQLRAAAVARVVILPDHDDPGWAHAQQVAAACTGAALEVRVVALPNLPAKGDVSDWIAAGGTADALRALAQAAPVWTHARQTDPTPTVAPQSLQDVEQAFARWLRDADPVPTRAVLATYVANSSRNSDPVWLMLVAGSGLGKTERIIPIAVMDDVVLASSISGPAALLSGTGKKERARDATGGLLRRLPEGGGVLVLKDFTSVIDMQRDPRAEVLAALRECYDGRWDRNIGAEGGRTLTWIGHLGVLAGCTTAIDAAHAVVATMGTRFVFVRLEGDGGGRDDASEGPAADVAYSALEHVGQESPMRAELRAVVRGLLSHLPGAPYPIDAVRDALAALGTYVARARSPVDRDVQGEIRLVLDPEAPTRIVKMLAQLWQAAGRLGLARSEAWAMVRRVGLDSIPKLRRLVLDVLARQITPPNTTAIAEAVEHPTRTTRRALEDLTAHRVIRRLAGGEGKADRWELTERTRHWLAMTLPVLLDPPQSPYTGASSTSSTDTKITTSNKTGKVPRSTAKPPNVRF